MEKKRFTASIDLKKIKGQEMRTQKGTLGYFIPYDQNHVFIGEKVRSLPIAGAFHDEPDRYDQNGYIKQAVSSEVYKNASKAEKEQFKELPFLGNIKIWQYTEETQQDPESIQAPSEDDDDLPF